MKKYVVVPLTVSVCIIAAISCSPMSRQKITASGPSKSGAVRGLASELGDDNSGLKCSLAVNDLHKNLIDASASHGKFISWIGHIAKGTDAMADSLQRYSRQDVVIGDDAIAQVRYARDTVQQGATIWNAHFSNTDLQTESILSQIEENCPTDKTQENLATMHSVSSARKIQHSNISQWLAHIVEAHRSMMNTFEKFSNRPVVISGESVSQARGAVEDLRQSQNQYSQSLTTIDTQFYTAALPMMNDANLNVAFMELPLQKDQAQATLEKVMNDFRAQSIMLVFGNSSAARDRAAFGRKMSRDIPFQDVRFVWIKDTRVLTPDQIAKWGVSDKNLVTLLTNTRQISAKVGNQKFFAWPLTKCTLGALAGESIEKNHAECRSGE